MGHRASGLAVAIAIATVPFAFAFDPAEASAEGDALPVGTFTPDTWLGRPCITGYVCRSFTVACDSLRSAVRGTLAIGEGRGEPRGVLVTTPPGYTQGWWGPRADMLAMLEELRDAGITVVQVSFRSYWQSSVYGERAGYVKLGCRVATVYDWVHENVYAPLGVTPAATGVCGFCVTGNSGGTLGPTAALAFYGQDQIIDAAIPTAGPVFSDIAKGCSPDPADADWNVGAGSKGWIDKAYGFDSTTGPCVNGDITFQAQWSEDSQAHAGNDYDYPHTRLHVVLGAWDKTMAGLQGPLFADAAMLGGSPLVIVDELPRVGHAIPNFADGRAAIRDAVLWTP